MDIITIDLKLLKNLDLNVNEYLTLLKMHMIGEEDPVAFPFASSDRVIQSLMDKHWITAFDSEDATGATELEFTDKANRLFDQEDLFQEFLELFPTRVPNGVGGFRPVSPSGIQAKSAQIARSLWMKHVGKNLGRQREVIEALRKELAYRNKDGSIQYLNNMQTWLRQAKWEDWIDIPNPPANNSQMKQL